MKHSLWIALFLCGVLLAACTRQNSPLVLAAHAAEQPAPAAAQAGTEGGYYLAWNGKNAFVLHFVDPATGRDTPVAAASGSTVRFERDGRVFWGRVQA